MIPTEGGRALDLYAGSGGSSIEGSLKGNVQCSTAEKDRRAQNSRRKYPND